MYRGQANVIYYRSPLVEGLWACSPLLEMGSCGSALQSYVLQKEMEKIVAETDTVCGGHKRHLEPEQKLDSETTEGRKY